MSNAEHTMGWYTLYNSVKFSIFGETQNGVVHNKTMSKSVQRTQFLGEHTMGWYTNSLSQRQVSGRRHMRWYIMHNVKFSVPVSRHNGIVHTVTMSKSVYGSQFLREHIMGWFTK